MRWLDKVAGPSSTELQVEQQLYLLDVVFQGVESLLATSKVFLGS